MLIPTILIGAVVVISIVMALARYRDTFHPTLILGPMLAFHYCYSPLALYATNGFFGYLSEDHLAWAQWVHLSGVVAICVGMFMGSGRTSPRANAPAKVAPTYDQKRLFWGAMVLAFLGVASFASGVANAGGLLGAYGEAYGAGYSESGWVRDLTLLCLPGLILFMLSQEQRPFTFRTLLIMIGIASPFLIHGLLGARRGPTFMIFAGTAMAMYMVAQKRPRILTMAAGGALLGISLLFLVANRKAIYLGSEMKLEDDPSAYFRPSAGNDFICGAGLIVVCDETDDFTWGATYLTVLFVRPIPRSIWPNKYEDAAAFFGRPPLTENLGIDVTAFRRVLGWTATIGSAPGIVADMWREFSWGMLIVLFGIGALYGYAWRRAVDKGRAWLAIYCYLASLSLYLVMQTLEAMLYRFLFGVVPMLWALRRARLPRVDLDPHSDTPIHENRTSQLGALG